MGVKVGTGSRGRDIVVVTSGTATHSHNVSVESRSRYGGDGRGDGGIGSGGDGRADVIDGGGVRHDREDLVILKVVVDVDGNGGSCQAVATMRGRGTWGQHPVH